jgi:DNA replication protein DnaC
MRARKFVEGYPIESGGTGLLLTGSIGVGKTHLAVGILQAVIMERGASGLFWDYRELLKEVQNSYNRIVIMHIKHEAKRLIVSDLT